MSEARQGFRKDFEIAYNSLNPDFSATYTQMLNIAAETGLAHAEAVGVGMDFYLEIRQGWVLTRWDAVFHKFPKWGDMVVSRTWPTSFKGFVAERSHLLTAHDGEILMSAVNSWVYFDFGKRAAAKPSREIVAKYGDLGGCVHTPDYATLTRDEVARLPEICVAARTVRRGDVDTNGHMNNVKYVEWARDFAPEGAAGAVKRLRAAYKKECLPGDRVIVETRGDGAVAAFRMKKDDGTSVAEIDLEL